MMNNKFYLFILCLFVMHGVQAQSQFGEIRGKVLNEKTKEPLDFISILVEQNGQYRAGAQSEIDGSFTIKTLTPGKYTIKATLVGFQSVEVNEIRVVANEITYQNIEMAPITTELKAVKILTSRVPIIRPDGSGGQTLSSEEIIRMPQRNVNLIANTVAGVVSVNGGTPNFRGARADGTAYYVDGVRTFGNPVVPQNAIDQISVITSGVPAQYGDYTGGAISITTKGPSARRQSAIELITSTPFDAYDYNEIQAFQSGPLLLKNRGDREKERAVLGYSVGARFLYARDGNPVPGGTYRLTDERLREIQKRPLVPDGGSFVPNAEFTSFSDLEKINFRDNAKSYSAALTGNLNYQFTDNINLTFGGQANYDNGRLYSWSSSLFNNDNNAQQIVTSYRTFLRFTQTFKPDKDDKAKKSLISNAFYQIRVDYTNRNVVNQDPRHQDNFFNYGYIGKFNTYRVPFYSTVDIDPNSVPRYFVNDKGDTLHRPLFKFREQAGFTDTLYTFERAELNPVLANYTSNFYNQATSPVRTLDEVRSGLGLINGDGPAGIYSFMYTGAGALQSNYSKSQIEQYTLFAMGEATINNRNNPEKKHDLQFGLTYEQRVQRGYSISGNSLYGLARQLANSHLSQLDLNNPIFVTDANGVFQDTVKYNRLNNTADQSTFDKNFRNKLISQGARDVYGNPITETTFIDVNSYAPHEYRLDMFSADELLNNGSSAVSYFGYDYLGNKVKGKPSYSEFLNDEAKRTVGAFTPVYTAAWIQDKFAFKDLIFRIGARVERYDANQRVLKDPYSFYPMKTVGEVKTEGKIGNTVINPGDIPNTIGDDYVVYIADVDNPSGKPVGYRNPATNTFYNKEGNVITDPAILAPSGRIAPYLVDPLNQKLTDASFVDYVPQVNVLPRIYFSFPISTTAQFFTTYDVLAQRPTEGNISTIDDYYFIQTRSNQIIPNPNLKPTKRTDYELGFKQLLTPNSGISLIASYSEIRNMIQQFRYNHAYPISYTTYGNLDFATVKGFRIEYELRDQGNVNFDANYTLQFADGTGSNSGSSQALIAVGQPNLRTLFPVDFDIRHILKGKFDYHFKDGKDYNGPVINRKDRDGNNKKINVLENAGVNMILNAQSGRPYTQTQTPTPDAQAGIVTRSPIRGTINGARLPWQFFADATVDKTVRIKLGKNDEGVQKWGGLTIYIWVQNVFNTRNIINVYSYSGSASDDGYLESPVGQRTALEATNTQSFIDLYNVKIANPDRLSTPRLTRLGIRLNF